MVAATITPHHLLISPNDIFAGGLQPHIYCLPIAKRKSDLTAIRWAAVSGDPRFFFGSDSAPHLLTSKEGSLGAAGIFNVPTAVPYVAQVFEEGSALDKLEGLYVSVAFALINWGRLEKVVDYLKLNVRGHHKKCFVLIIWQRFINII